MANKLTSALPVSIRDDEWSIQQLGMQYHLNQAEVKTLIDYYKRKDPQNKGLLPNQFKEAAGEFIAGGLTIDPNVVFNIFHTAESGVVGRVSLREFVLGYAILSRGTTENRLRYLFALYGSDTSANEKDIDTDFLTREQLINCLRLMQRIVSEVTDDEDPNSAAAHENDEHIQDVADNLIEESQIGSSPSDCISFTDFIEKVKETDVIMSWLEKLREVAGDHLKHIEHLERDVVELELQREGILSGSSVNRSNSFANMDWYRSGSNSPSSPKSPGSPKAAQPKSSRISPLAMHSVSNRQITFAATPTQSFDRKRKIPMPRKQKLVRRDLCKMKSTDSIDTRPHHETNGYSQTPNYSNRNGVPNGRSSPPHGNGMDMDAMMDLSKRIANDNANESTDELDDEEINAAKPFLINYDQIEFGKVLGRGACATVYEGTWLHIPVAVKVFNDEHGKHSGIDGLASVDEEARKAKVGDYVEEFWMLLQIRHPNCLLYMGICFEPYVCIVTELFSGGSVANYLHGPNAQKFLPTKAVDMISDVARGMYYLHASSPPILHRDLKASNILINRMMTHCVICDFGLSRQFVREISGRHPNGFPSQRRQESGVIGTVNTMAPEVMEGKEYTPAADVYSFGIVMYEMYLGQVVFPKLKPVQVMFHVSEGKRPTFNESDKVPPSLLGLIQRCWAQNPDDRPTFEEILSVLTSEKLKAEINEAQEAAETISNKPGVHELSKQLLDVAFMGRDEELLKLINAGADVNYCDYDKRTALHVGKFL